MSNLFSLGADPSKISEIWDYVYTNGDTGKLLNGQPAKYFIFNVDYNEEIQDLMTTAIARRENQLERFILSSEVYFYRRSKFNIRSDFVIEDLARIGEYDFDGRPNQAYIKYLNGKVAYLSLNDPNLKLTFSRLVRKIKIPQRGN